MENKFPVNKVEPKIYRLEDIKKSYDKDKIEGFTKYTPYRHCYRSTSLIEPNTSNSYSNPIYFRNTNFSSENFDSKYNSENKTNIGGGGSSSSSSITTSKYNSRPYLSSHSDETQDALASMRGVSRFGKPDYFDNCVYSKERQKREMETQKVLKEIRNKRINDHREKYRTRDKSNSRLNETIENGNHEQPQQQQKQKPVEKSEPPQEKPSTNEVKEETKSIKREGKISKLIRPKSYPAENSDASNTAEIKTNGVSPEKTIKSKLFKRNTDKSSPAKDLQNADDKKSNNQFLSSIEKKIRSLYSESPPPTDKIKTDPPSRVQNTIRSLREQSEPRNIEHCVTESGLIKRAVSSEDFSVFGTNKPNTKTLQPSRKSVSKILGLFKKYEDKQPHGKSSKNTEETSKKGKTDDSTKKKIKAEKTKTSTSKNKKECTCNPEIKPNEVAVKKSGSKTKTTSKLPVSNSSRNSSAEPETNLTNQLENDNKFVPIPDLAYTPDRRDLKLNLNKLPISDHPRVNDFLTDNREQSLPLFSPCDESNDSWSVCSDMHRQDMSPMSDNKLFSEEEAANESVIDRIRRKSFYCRFNEKKKPRKTSLVENRYDYTKYDKYADIPNNAIKSRSLKDCATDQKPYAYTAPSSTKESKLCKRALSMNDNYSYHKYGGSKSNANLSPEDKLLDAIDKNLNPKSKKSYLKTPTRFSDRITKSPPLNGNVGEGSSNNDVSAPL